MFKKLSISIKILFSTYRRKKRSTGKKKEQKSKSERLSSKKHEKKDQQKKQGKTKEVDMCTSTYSCRCYSSCSCSYSTCTYYLSPFRSPKHAPNCRCKSRRSRNRYSSDDDDDVYLVSLSCDEVAIYSPRTSYDGYIYCSSSRYSYRSSSRGSRFDPYYVPLDSSSSLTRWWSRGSRSPSGGGRRATESMKIVPRGSSGRYY